MPPLPRPDPYDIGVNLEPPINTGALVYPFGITEGTEASRHYLIMTVSNAGGYNGGGYGPVGPGGGTIALYMPAMLFADTHVYEAASLSALGGALLVNEVSAAYNSLGGQNPFWAPHASKKLNATAGAAIALSPLVPGLSDGMKLGQRPILTAAEIMYANTMQRVFDFQFFFTPRNQSETNIIKEIIKTIRYYAAPEPLEEGDYIVQWAAPGRFKFEVHHNDGINDNIIKIDECVITNIETDYTTGTEGKWATFKDGMPIATRFQFKAWELEPVHRKKILEGF